MLGTAGARARRPASGAAAGGRRRADQGDRAKRNALVGIATWIPGIDLPILTLNQLRLVFGIAIAGGRALDAGVLPELLGVAGAAYGWRRVARTLEGLPVPAVVVRSGVAFAGTLAVGAAVRRRLA